MYMAPEMIKNQRTGKLGACDIWGLGCIVLQMITGRKPWSFLDFDNEWYVFSCNDVFRVGSYELIR